MILPLERRIVLLQDWKDELDFHVKLIHAWKDLLLLGDTYFVSLESDLLLSFDHLLLLSRVLCLQFSQNSVLAFCSEPLLIKLDLLRPYSLLLLLLDHGSWHSSPVQSGKNPLQPKYHRIVEVVKGRQTKKRPQNVDNGAVSVGIEKSLTEIEPLQVSLKEEGKLLGEVDGISKLLS